MNNQTKTPFFTELLKYSKSNTTSFDVPGHKMGELENDITLNGGEILYKLDANAPIGLDNLNKPKSVIKEAEELCAEAFNAKKAYFLVNGCTSAIQVMIMSVVKENEYILLPRNSHKSVINAIILSGANPIFIEPEYDYEYGFAKNLSVDVIKQAIDNNPFAKAILLINPTYFGEVLDLEEVIDYAHKKNIYVLVDEAHGTHYSFSDLLPDSAISKNADIIASSMHKTGLSLTQSSVLFTNRLELDTEIRTIINMLQTTSPSSLLIASLDVARKDLYFNSKNKINELFKYLKEFKEKAKELNLIEVLDEEYFLNNNTYKYDSTKLIVSFKKLGISGFRAYKLLKEKYNIQAELGEKFVVLFVLTSSTTKEDLGNLINAFVDMEKTIIKQELKDIKIFKNYPKQIIKPRDAYNSSKMDVKIEDSLGFISAESIMIYPPGIPLIVAGEQIDQNIIDIMIDYINDGIVLYKDSPDGMIRVAKI